MPVNDNRNEQYTANQSWIEQMPGEMGELMRQHNWADTPLGPIENWPQSLQTAVSICLFSRYPIVLWWGKDLVKIYNDAYRPILGTNKHPRALGRPGREAWAEIWNIIGPMLESVIEEDTATWSDNQMLPIDRHGFTEETYFTFSYSPIFDELGGIGGVFTAVTETTPEVLSQRRLTTLHNLSNLTTETKTDKEVCLAVAQALAANQADLPFSLIYLLDKNKETAQLFAHTGFADSADIGQLSFRLDDTTAPWPFRDMLATTQTLLIEDVSSDFQHPPAGIWPEMPQQALLLPITTNSYQRIIGFLLLGISPRLRFDENYRNFFHLIAGHVAAAISNARTYEEERQRAEALAELDRAKVEFFSNVSHEFRTPLTLLLNPLQETLRDAENLSRAQLENLEMAYRNSLRLLKLVNTLLDFSRIQSNRIHASFEATELASFTSDLASNFRSIIERAGLRYIVNCPPLSEPVYVDREMWEKIVLNLISNAFKFTFTGEIEVSLEAGKESVYLKLRDTGIGISEDDTPHIFERFHRVRGARSRTHEGSGIGLALVAELVRFHGGEIRVASKLGYGTTFTISIPLGLAHLPTEQISAVRQLESTASGVAPYVEEASRWLLNPQEESSDNPVAKRDTGLYPVITTVSQRSESRILVIDDNADMRDYLKKLLQPHYQIELANDGQEAIRKLREFSPSLLILDVMLPNLDGFALLRQIRSDHQIRALPVILLSARAGEEARIEGLQLGADDYLTKPFSPRELLVRIEGQLNLAQLRQETSATIEDIIESIADPFYVLDQNWHLIFANQRAQEMWGKSSDELMGVNIAEVFLQGLGRSVYEAMLKAVESRQPSTFETFYIPLNRWVEVTIYPSRKGIAVYLRNIQERKEAEEARLLAQNELQAERQRIVDIFESISDAFVTFDKEYRYTYLNTRAEEMMHTQGKSREELLGSSVWDIYPELYESLLGETLRHAMHEGKMSHITTFFSPLNAWLDIRIYPSKEGISVYFTDVTERQETQNALHIAEERLGLAQQVGNVGLWDWKAEGNQNFWNETMWELYGLEPYSRPMGNLWEAMIHPQDRQHVKDKVAHTLASNESYYSDEFRIVQPSGAIRWLHSIARVVRDEAGQPVRMAGVNIDVTARKEMEETLRKTEGELRAMIDSAKDYAIFSTDMERTVTSWNTGAERIFGYQEAEILGQSADILFTPEDRTHEIPQKEVAKAIHLGYAEDERWHLRKDGSRFYASGMVRPIIASSGVLQGFIKVARDLTARHLQN